MVGDSPISEIRRAQGIKDEPYLLIPSAAEASDGGSEDMIDLRRMFRMLWRAKWLLAGATALGLGAGYLFASQQTPLYAAQAQIMLETRRPPGEIAGLAPGGGELSNAALLTELQLLRSNILLERVVDALDLAALPEFAPDPREPGGLRGKLNALAAGMRLPEPFPGDPEAVLAKADIVETLQSKVQVAREDNSYAINIRTLSEDPALAAAISNAIAQQYIELQYNNRQESLGRISDWLDGRIDTMRLQVEEAEERVEALRAETLAIEGMNADTISRQLESWSSTLAQSRADLAEREARLQEFYNARANGSSDVGAVLEGNATVAALRARLGDLSTQKTELVVTYGANSAQAARIAEREEAVRQELSEAVERQLISMRDEAALRATAAADYVKELAQSAQALSERSLRLRQAEREASTLQQVYGNLLTQRNESDAQQPMPQVDARVVARAEPASDPSQPRSALILAAGGVLGLGAALGAVAFSEFMRRTYRSREDLEVDLKLPLLATIPRGRWKGRGRLADWMRSQDGLAFVEAVRQLRSALLFSAPQQPRAVMITSAGIGEGKSTLALALASLCAGIGKRVLLVDGDLRRASVSAETDPDQRRDLAAVIAGRASPEQAIIHDHRLGFDILPSAGLGTLAPVDALSTPAFRSLVEGLKRDYDLLVFDTAPVLHASDALVIGKLADSTIFVVREGASLADVVKQALTQLLDMRIPVTGVALNMSSSHMAPYPYAGLHPMGAEAYRPQLKAG